MNLFKSKQLIINEAINFLKEVIFIAIPKTGTTTVRKQLRQEGKPLIKNPHLNILQVRDLIYAYLLKEYLGTNQTYPNTERQSDSDLREEAKKIFENYFKFSAVRNPWARTVSLYFRREGISSNHKMSFEDFCKNHIYASDTCRQPTLHNNQYDWISSDEGDLLVDYVYKVEEFERAIHEIKEMTNGRLVLKNQKQNKNPTSKSSDYRNMYNGETKNLIAKRFEKDIDYFKYSF